MTALPAQALPVPGSLPGSLPSDFFTAKAMTSTNTFPTSPSYFAELTPPSQQRSGRHPPPNRPSPPTLSHHTKAGTSSPLPRSVSADAAAPKQPSLHLVQRLTQQNSLIREAWEAERNYLEANRRRAEEVYQEERVIMDEVREDWENEKSSMALEIQVLKERIQRLEGENATLRAVTAQSVQLSGVVSPLGSLHGGGGGGGVDGRHGEAGLAGFFAHRNAVAGSRGSPLSPADPDSLPPGLDGASRRPHFASQGGPRMSPNQQPEFSSFVPLDPRVQPEKSVAHDFLPSPTAESETPIPIIDVQELDPKLEGIPIRAAAVHKSTFGDVSHKSSPATSPPESGKPTLLHPEPASALPRRLSSKDHTLQVLAAGESRRRTMHAGHTPNHSLSLFPTLTSASGQAAAGASTDTHSEGIMSTATAGTTSPEPLDPKEEVETALEEAAQDPRDSQLDESKDKDAQEVPLEPEIAEPLLQLEPVDDVPLKGPLMIKNIPAQDEIFWAKVDQKLESLSQGQNLLPTVMRECQEEADAGPFGALDPIVAEPVVAQVPLVNPVGGDASQDAQAGRGGDDTEAGTGENHVEADVPLRLRSTTNFGAPFGAV